MQGKWGIVDNMLANYGGVKNGKLNNNNGVGGVSATRGLHNF